MYELDEVCVDLVIGEPEMVWECVNEDQKC